MFFSGKHTFIDNYRYSTCDISELQRSYDQKLLENKKV